MRFHKDKHNNRKKKLGLCLDVCDSILFKVDPEARESHEFCSPCLTERSGDLDESRHAFQTSVDEVHNSVIYMSIKGDILALVILYKHGLERWRAFGHSLTTPLKWNIFTTVITFLFDTSLINLFLYSKSLEQEPILFCSFLCC